MIHINIKIKNNQIKRISMNKLRLSQKKSIKKAIIAILSLSVIVTIAISIAVAIITPNINLDNNSEDNDDDDCTGQH
jgi:1,4-dihydroxy-2-naphthoate octaprenyltransferase